MKLSFIPADLHLTTERDGQFRVIMQGNELLSTRSCARAMRKFNEIKKELEAQFPIHDLTDEEKKELLQRSISDSLVKHNSLKTEKKKSAAKGTRTYG